MRRRYAHEAPRAAENFRAMCTGEKGGALTFQGMRFYRIIDMFIDQVPATDPLARIDCFTEWTC